MDAEMIEVAAGRDCERGEVMREPDEVAAMIRLKALGWGVRRIARELGCKDEHAVSRRGDYGCAFFVEIDIEGFGVGAEVLALDDYLGRYRPGFRIERFEFDGFVGLVSRIPPPSSPSEHADSPIPAVRQASHKCNRHLQ